MNTIGQLPDLLHNKDSSESTPVLVEGFTYVGGMFTSLEGNNNHLQA